MDVPSDPHGRNEHRRRAITLSTFQRIMTAAFGTLAALAGGVAVYVTANQVGSTALIVIGALAFLIGIVGRVPDKIGKEGVEYQPLDDYGKAAIETVASVAADETLPRKLRDVVVTTMSDEVRKSPTERSDRTADEVRTFLRETVFERDALAHIDAIRPDGVVLLTEYQIGVPPDDWRVDAVLVPDRPGPVDLAKGVVIDVRYSDAYSYTMTKLLLERVASLAPGGFLHVVHFRLPRELHDDFQEMARAVGLRNAHLVAGDMGSAVTRRLLAHAVGVAWAGVPGDDT